ncbi:MAG: chloride channel protein [Dehalococcoidia bacterium]|nr:chloride channel protein [Dehalococcoidia bacterium]
MHPARLLLLTVAGAFLGLVGGVAAWGLLHLIGLITNRALYGRWAWDLPPTTMLERSPMIVIAAVAGALIVALMAHAAPIIRGHGIPEAMESILLRQSRIAPRAALLKPLSAAIAIGTGGPFGAEGPIIVTGGASGSLLGQVMPVSPSERKILLAAGAAAGMSATFGAPLASIVLAFELLLFEFSSRSLVPVATASAVAGAMHYRLIDVGPLFEAPTHELAGLTALPSYAVLGLLCGGLAVVVARGLFLVEGGFRRLPVSEFWHPAIGALGFALVGLLVPRVLGVGYDVIEDMLSGHLALSTVLAIFAAKLVAWWLALGSGTSGGTLAPVLIVGSAFGAALALMVGQWTPFEVSATGFALVAMAATFGASTGASLTAIVFMFELTQDYRIVLPLILATVLADLVASTLLRDTLMTEKLTRRGVRVVRDYRADTFARTHVDRVMTSPAESLPADASIADAQRILARGHHSAYPLVDSEGRCRGVISRTDLLAQEQPDSDARPLLDIASRDVVSVQPQQSVSRAMEVMLEESVEHLPVLDRQGYLLGMFTRTDVLRARAVEAEEERPQEAVMLRRMMRAARVRHAGTRHPRS